MAKGISALFGNIQSNKNFSKRRKIWTDFTNKTVCGIGSFEYSRRVWKEDDRGVHSGIIYSLWLYCELETQVLLSGDLGFINGDDLEKLRMGVGDVERMLKGLIKSLGNL